MVETCGNCRNLSPGFMSSVDNRNFRNLTFHLGPAMVVFCLFAYLMPVTYSSPVPIRTAKRMTLADPGTDDLPDGGSPDHDSRLQYDGYPIVVSKRAALILDRILKEIESAKESNQLINDWSPISRRGNNKDKLYFRCYFNAVSCYKRK